MNHISGTTLLFCLITCTACSAPASETESVPKSPDYSVHYQVNAIPNEGAVTVEMVVEQSRGNLRELRFSADRSRLFNIDGDGELITEGDTIRWLPAREGGRLRWQARIAGKRSSGAYDAWLDGNWGIFRAEDIIPRATTRTLKGANSKTSISFGLPTGWSAVSEYSSLNSRIEVDNPSRRFDQPSGWIAMGDLGIRRETIAGTRIAIAAPEGENVRRMDMLALLNWVLPELNSILPDQLPRLTIVSAGEPMWRGALSAPASFFIHADRPLISENATSTLVHELMHVAMGISADDGFDWIVEGLAEYYSLELLQRGGAITARRYKRALEAQAKWAKKSEKLCGRQSTGANTARAVMVFRNLDVEIQKTSGGKLSLDDVVVELAARPANITLSILVSTVTKLLQENPTTLNIDALPGCQYTMPTSEA